MPLFAEICMEQANTNSKPAPLPLFRAEALAARRQGMQGDILLIRPLSLVLLGWLGMILAASAIGFLVLGKYTPTQKVEGTIHGTTPMRGEKTAIELAVASSQLTALRPGQEMRVRCTGCESALTGTIIRVSPPPLHPEDAGAHQVESAVTIAFPQTVELTAGTKVQAEVQLEKKPLLVWLLGRAGT